MNDQYQHCNQQLAIDPVTIVIRECITLATAMRKFTKYYSQSTNVAALLTGTNSNNEDKHAELFSNYKNFTGILDSEISRFNDKKEQDTTTATEEEAEQTSISTETSTTIKKNSPANNSGLLNSNTFVNNDPLLAGFLQLRTMLNSKVSLQNIDALTLLQPFLLVISTSTTSGYITNLALTSLQKFFFQYKIINTYSKNYQAAFKQSVVSLTHCRFEGSEQLSDDSVLLKVLELMRNLVTSEQYNTIMSDSIMYEVLQTVMSLACNKRRSEVLRRAAEMTMMEITSTLFMKLKTINSSSQNAYINDEDYTKNGLKDDTIGTSSDTKEIIEKENTEENIVTGSAKKDTGKEEIYGLPVIKDYLGILISLIMPENQHKHNYSTRILSLQLLNIAFEISGDHFPHHPVLFTLVSDPIFKNILYIIKNAKNTKPSLLQAALQAFVTLSLVMGEYLEMQIELTLKTIFDIVSDPDDDQVASVAKELLIEQIAILWTRSKPSFFTKLFVTYDCNLNRSDLCVDFIKYLSKLSLPESASTTADIVPPICLNGLISFIEDTYVLLTNNMGCDLDVANTYLEQRERKAKFIESTQLFNEKPKKGLPLLLSNGFIENDNKETIAKFLYENKGRLNKKTIGEYIADPKNISLLKHFISNFNFQGLRVDEAIRVLLTKFRLPGESQQIERIVESFAAKYVEDQKYDSDRETINEVEDDYATVQPDADSVFILSYSIIMLNTDLHNPQVKKHMTFDDYTYNLKGCNNNKNFPLWYLDRIYCSIRDKEIVMPEEHHGNEEWFDDAWNNLISSFNVYIEYKDTQGNTQELTDTNSLIQFDRAIFEQAGESIISTLFKIFEIATDDHISIKMLSTLDKCCYIAFAFGSANALNTVIKRLVSISLLDGEFNEESESDNIPLVEILEDERNKKVSYSVSNLGVKFGRDFKAQLVTILLFNIFQNNNRLGLISEDSWFSLAQIVLNLYENKIMLPDCFPSIQKKFRLPPLPRPTPDYTINKSQKESNNRSGLLSTFASYLKGDEEPTLQELNASLSTYQCIATCNLQETLLGNKYNFTDGKFIMAVLKLLDGNRVLAEGTKLFLIEFMVGLFFNHLETTHVASSEGVDDALLGKLIQNKFFEITEKGKVSRPFVLRILVYKIWMLSFVQQPDILDKLLNEEVLSHNEIYDDEFFENKNIGGEFLRKILHLATTNAYKSKLFHLESFWKILRKFASYQKHVLVVYNFIDTQLFKNTVSAERPSIKFLIDDTNFMWLLGLLDEISSIGAVGNQWEKEYEKLIKTGHKVTKENPYQEIVELSLRSINMTSCLFDIFANGAEDDSKLNKTETFALIQALAHQCLNPCFQLRTYALDSLDKTINEKSFVLENIGIAELMDNGLIPLLDHDEQNAKSDILHVLGSAYLHYLSNNKTDNGTYLKVLEVFNKYVEDPKVEQELQAVITKKKEIEKELNA